MGVFLYFINKGDEVNGLDYRVIEIANKKDLILFVEEVTIKQNGRWVSLHSTKRGGEQNCQKLH